MGEYERELESQRPITDRAVAYWDERGTRETLGQGLRFLDEKVERAWDRLAAVGLLDRYCLAASKRRLRQWQSAEDDLYGVIATAYGFRGLGLYRSIEPMQEASELVGLVELVADENPRTAVEIGTARGGSLYVLARRLDAAETLVSVDNAAVHDQRGQFFEAFASEKEVCTVTGSSHRPRTVERVRRALPNDEIDFLFIDGDHSYSGVKRDFELYEPLVADGGIVAFHDVVETENPNMGVPQFWRDVREEYDSREIVRPPDSERGGIGVLFT